MKNTFTWAILFLFVTAATCFAQGNRGAQGNRDAQGKRKSQTPGGALNVPDNPQAIGAAGVAWYTTWDTGLAEAQRSNRPIFFMSAATTCSGVSGVF